MEKESKLLELEKWYHFKCDCMVCANKTWSPSSNELDFTEDPLYREAVQPIDMTVQLFRKQAPAGIEAFERNDIAFLEKYDRFHAVSDTIALQATLFGMWNVLFSRY